MSKLRYIPFIHLFNYLLSKYYVPGTIPDDRDVPTNMQRILPSRQHTYTVYYVMINIFLKSNTEKEE